MAFSGYEVDEEFAEEGFVKIYFDFDTPEECGDFADWANENWDAFQELVDKFYGKETENGAAQIEEALKTVYGEEQ